MSESKAAPGFPYDHLAILGFDRLKRYVPPMKSPPAPQSRPAAEEDETATPSSDEDSTG
jgi:hypothetical protein